MGTWGTRIFDDDGAADICAEYRILLGYKVDPEKAWQLIYNYFYPEYKGSDDEDVFWLSVALFQWQNGILKEEVKQKALQCIDDESYLEVWKESDSVTYKKRKAVLTQLKEKLINEVNPPRKVPKCPTYYRQKTGFAIGDIFSYTHENGNISYVEVVRIRKEPVTELAPDLDHQSKADFALIDVWSPKRYSLEELTELHYRRFFNGDFQRPYSFNVYDTFSVYDENIVRESMEYVGRIFRSMSKDYTFYGGFIIQSYPREYAPYIELTFSLPCSISNEILNTTLTEFMNDATIKTLEQRIISMNLQWPKILNKALVLVILRNVYFFIDEIRVNRILKRDIKEKDKDALDKSFPWINEENTKSLIDKIIPEEPELWYTEYGKQVENDVSEYFRNLKQTR